MDNVIEDVTKDVIIQGHAYTQIICRLSKKVIGFIDEYNEEVLRMHNNHLVFTSKTGDEHYLNLGFQADYELMHQILIDCETDIDKFIDDKAVEVIKL